MRPAQRQYSASCAARKDTRPLFLLGQKRHRTVHDRLFSFCLAVLCQRLVEIEPAAYSLARQAAVAGRVAGTSPTNATSTRKHAQVRLNLRQDFFLFNLFGSTCRPRPVKRNRKKEKKKERTSDGMRLVEASVQPRKPQAADASREPRTPHARGLKVVHVVSSIH